MQFVDLVMIFNVILYLANGWTLFLVLIVWYSSLYEFIVPILTSYYQFLFRSNSGFVGVIFTHAFRS